MTDAHPTARFAALDRAQLMKSTQRVLNRGRWGNPDVLLVDTACGPVVVKDFAPRRIWLRRVFGRRLIAREARAYRCLDGVAGVPRLLGWLDADAIVIEYRPGVLLSRSLAGKLPREFLAELEAAIDSMHRRGVVHLDLRHRSNILAGHDGHPVLLDFASALRFDPSRAVGRVAIRTLGWFDRRALRKWRARLDQPTVSAGVAA